MKTVGNFMAEWTKLWEEDIIKKAMKEGKFINLDDICKDGKLFGCRIIHTDPFDAKAYGMSLTKLDYHSKESGKNYILDYNFDWEYESFILSYTKFENGIPYKARFEINFRMLFDVKPGMEQMVFEHAAESVIREVEKLIEDDK